VIGTVVVAVASAFDRGRTIGEGEGPYRVRDDPAAPYARHAD
jgi:hypothetical protein